MLGPNIVPPRRLVIRAQPAVALRVLLLSLALAFSASGCEDTHDTASPAPTDGLPPPIGDAASSDAMALRDAAPPTDATVGAVDAAEPMDARGPTDAGPPPTDATPSIDALTDGAPPDGDASTRPDATPSVDALTDDASARPDARPRADAGGDAAPPRDAASLDGSASADAAPRPDAASPLDAMALPDAARPLDAGGAPDAAPRLDATARLDATPPADAAPPPDARPRDALVPDAGPLTLRAVDLQPAPATIDDALTVHLVVEGATAPDSWTARCAWRAATADGPWTPLPDADGTTLAACVARAGCAAGDRVRVTCEVFDGERSSDAVTSEAVTLRPSGCRDEGPTCYPPTLGPPPLTSPFDFTFGYWPINHRPVAIAPAYERVLHVINGHFGLAFDESTGALPHFGVFAERITMAAARHIANAAIEALPAAELRFEAGPAADPALLVGFRSDGVGLDDRALLRDGGRFAHVYQLAHADYANAPAPLEGQVELSVLPRHVVFSHTVDDPFARVALGGGFLAHLSPEWLAEGRALRLSDDTGAGWLFVVYGQATMSFVGGRVIAEHVAPEGQTHRVSLLAAPLSALSPHEVDLFVDPEAVATLTYTLLDAEGRPVGAPTPIPWDEHVGAFRADLGTLAAAGLEGPRDYDLRPELHTWYGRHRLTIDTHGRGDLAVPLAFFGTGGASLSITGGVASLRDARGAPVGVPVQISKNWHDATTGAWYHLYAHPIFPAGPPQTLELTMASSRWGRDAYAASHAQLSLIGYNSAGGHWDESALGAFGESITYDPDLALNRAMVDDVRPFLVRADQRWSWTGNVGGADFLRYQAAEEPGVLRRLGRVRSTYTAPGPNLTDVTYSGVTDDGRVRADINVQMGRTDDLVRVWYHLDYTLLEDVRYERLAFFQMAADRYGDNDFARMAWGNAAGVTEDRPLDDHGSTGYASPDDRGIPLDGDAPWVTLYDNRRQVDSGLREDQADIAYVVRDFEANVGGTVIRTPHLSLHRTQNRFSQYGLELGLPFVAGAPWCGDSCNGETAMLPAGTTVRATVEYLVVPADREAYYGASGHLLSQPPDAWRTPAMTLHLARGNALSVEATIGQVRRAHPVELDAAPGRVAVDFTLEGGLGYVPITIRGLTRHDGWHLQVLRGALWTAVDQAARGQDYWQATHDGATDTYALTYNVPNRGLRRYRLVWLRDCAAADAEPGACDTVDDCTSAPDVCDQRCVDLPGRFICGCEPGYTLGEDELTCVDVDECAAGQAACAQDCRNTTGGYLCACRAGYTLAADGQGCDDVDECADAALHGCPAGAPCVNTAGGFVCGCEPPDCSITGCTDPAAPNYQPGALNDDGSCFRCADGAVLVTRLQACETVDCADDWGECDVRASDRGCAVSWCRPATTCDAPAAPDAFADARDAVLALGGLTDPPAPRADPVGDAPGEVVAGEVEALYLDALPFQGAPTRAFALVGLPAGASAQTPVPGVVLLHGGGGTADRDWVDRWTARGYAAIAVALEGQTDQPAAEGEDAVGAWRRHAAAGPARVGAYGDRARPIADQWMYHAVADTVLAHSLLRSLPGVDADAVGLVGISWGAVVAATAAGVDPRFAFVVPIYGAGQKHTIPNFLGAALADDLSYQQVWDPARWARRVRAPALWLSWPGEDTFSLDSQAATYLRAPGPRVVSLVPGMGHGHAAAWRRPEPYDFADAIVGAGAPWIEQIEQALEGDQARVVFRADRPLTGATLLYTEGSGHTGDLTWLEVPVDAFVEAPAGVFAASATVPAAATAWFVNVTAARATSDPFGESAPEVLASSDYRERIALSLAPEDGLAIAHLIGADRTTSALSVAFTGPSPVEVIGVDVIGETHPGALCSPASLPRALEAPAPARETLPLRFDNTVAGLVAGQTAEAELSVVWVELDGSTRAARVPVQVTAVDQLTVTFDEDAPWSSRAVPPGADVVIDGGATVTLDEEATAATVTLLDGALVVPPGTRLDVSDALTVGAAGALRVTGGQLILDDAPLLVDGEVRLEQGALRQDMRGVRGWITGGGRIIVDGGTLDYGGALPPDVLTLDVDVEVLRGDVLLSGQIYAGQRADSIFALQGDAGTVSMVSLNSVGGRRGVFRFEVGANGVTEVAVERWMNLRHARVEVNGAGYAGGAAVLPLFTSTNLVEPLTEPNVTLSGFAENGYRATLVQDGPDHPDDVVLIIEPAP